MTSRRAVWALLALGTGSCLRPTEERAERDREVGQASAAALEVHVEEGLAAVRQLDEGKLVLWDSAPEVHVRLSNGGSLRSGFVLEIQNCLRDSVVRVAHGDRELALEQLPEPLPTRRRWRFDVPPRSELSLRVQAPDAGERTPFRFAVLSDVQEAIDRVQDIYRVINTDRSLRFLFGAGDLTEQGTPEELERFQRELESLDVPYYTTLGNHELGESPPAYHDYFGRGSFQFRFHGVRFTLLDSASASLDPIVFDWLDGWLEAGRDDVHIVSMHIPPLDPTGVRNGAFASRAEAAKLLGRLAQGGVDLTLYGHVHSYYSFENAGIPARISGGGGAIPERFDALGRHFLSVLVDPERGVRDISVVRVDQQGSRRR